MVQENVMAKNTITANMLRDAINLIRGAVMICYPQGLPKWDTVQQAISGIQFSCTFLSYSSIVHEIIHYDYDLSK